MGLSPGHRDGPTGHQQAMRRTMGLYQGTMRHDHHAWHAYHGAVGARFLGDGAYHGAPCYSRMIVVSR